MLGSLGYSSIFAGDAPCFTHVFLLPGGPRSLYLGFADAGDDSCQPGPGRQRRCLPPRPLLNGTGRKSRDPPVWPPVPHFQYAPVAQPGRAAGASERGTPDVSRKAIRQGTPASAHDGNIVGSCLTAGSTRELPLTWVQVPPGALLEVNNMIESDGEIPSGGGATPPASILGWDRSGEHTGLFFTTSCSLECSAPRCFVCCWPGLSHPLSFSSWGAIS